MSLTMSKGEAAEYNRIRLELKALMEQPGADSSKEYRTYELREQIRRMTRRFWMHDILQERATRNDLYELADVRCPRNTPMRSLVSGTLVAIESPDE